MIDWIIEFAVPMFFTVVSGWITIEVIGANVDARRWREIDRE